ncbi:hypothetical protein WA588_004969, partial [Blastocystis sp. NMH]
MFFTIFFILRLRYNKTMLFSQSEYVKASDLLEAFVKVAATTVGAVVAFAIYVLVLVALHVTKVVSHLMLFVGDFLDLLADELIVCIYKKADTIAAPSHSNITVEEEDASIAPLPEHNTHITEPVDASVAPEPVRLLADAHAQEVVAEEPVATVSSEKVQPAAEAENHIEEFATVDPVPVAVAPAPESEDIAEELPTEAPHAPEPVQLFADTHAQGNHMEEPAATSPVPVATMEPVSVFYSAHLQEVGAEESQAAAAAAPEPAIIEEFAVAEAAIEQPAVMEAAMEEPVAEPVAELTAVEPFVEEPVKVAEAVETAVEEPAAPEPAPVPSPPTQENNTEEPAVPVPHPTQVTFEELAALDPAIIVDSSLSPESNTLPADTAPLAETITERLMVEERSSTNAPILLGNSIIEDPVAFDQERPLNATGELQTVIVEEPTENMVPCGQNLPQVRCPSISLLTNEERAESPSDSKGDREEEAVNNSSSSPKSRSSPVGEDRKRAIRLFSSFLKRKTADGETAVSREGDRLSPQASSSPSKNLSEETIISREVRTRSTSGGSSSSQMDSLSSPDPNTRSPSGERVDNEKWSRGEALPAAKASPSRKNQQWRVESPAEKQKKNARKFYDKR